MYAIRSYYAGGLTGRDAVIAAEAVPEVIDLGVSAPAAVDVSKNRLCAMAETVERLGDLLDSCKLLVGDERDLTCCFP